MGTWQMSPEELVHRFDHSLPRAEGVERRKMFGCPSAFINGNSFAFVHEHRLVVRLPGEAPARPFPVGRPMREYAAFDGALDLEEAEFRSLIARAFQYASGLPARLPKQKKPTAAGKRAKGSAAKQPAAKKPAAKKRTVKKPAAA